MRLHLKPLWAAINPLLLTTMDQALPSATVKLGRYKLLKPVKSKYFPRLVDEFAIDTVPGRMCISEPCARRITDEETHFASALEALSEVDIAVYVNVSRVVAEHFGGVVSRERDNHFVLHQISADKAKFMIMCIKPHIAFLEEYDLVLNAFTGPLTPFFIETAADQNAPFFAVTDYVHWIFYQMHVVDDKVTVELKSVDQESVAPTVRSLVGLAFSCDVDVEPLQTIVKQRCELGRVLEIMQPANTRAYPKLSCAPFVMTRRKNVLEPAFLSSIKRRSGILDFLHDDLDIEYLHTYSPDCSLVCINGSNMMLQTFSTMDTWSKVISMYTKWLSSLQGTAIPFFYAAAITDPFRNTHRRELGILLEHVQAVPIKVWLQSPLAVTQYDKDQALELLIQNCSRIVHAIKNLNVSNGAILDSLVVCPLDLSVCLVRWDRARLGRGFSSDRAALSKLLHQILQT